MKKTKITVSMIPNLLTHSIVGLEVEPNFLSTLKPAYKNQYRNWALDEEKERLKKLRFTIDGVSSNANFAFLYQIPAYFSEDSIQSLKNTLNNLAAKTLDSFLDLYPEKKKRLAAYVPQKLISTVFGLNSENLQNISDSLHEYAFTVERIYDRDYKKRWDKIQLKLEEVKQRLSEYFHDTNWINEWETLTNLTFPYETFEVELIDALRTYGTSILAEKDGFYAYGPEKLLVAMISHEIGTHILFNTQTIKNQGIDKLIQEDVEMFLKGNELLAWSINQHILDTLSLKAKKYDKSFDSLDPMKSKIYSMMKSNIVEGSIADMEKLFSKSFKIMKKTHRNI